jgi:hypothetical protein
MQDHSLQCRDGRYDREQHAPPSRMDLKERTDQHGSASRRCRGDAKDYSTSPLSTARLPTASRSLLVGRKGSAGRRDKLVRDI